MVGVLVLKVGTVNIHITGKELSIVYLVSNVTILFTVVLLSINLTYYIKGYPCSYPVYGSEYMM